MTLGHEYCRYCEDQAEACLTAARDQDQERAYFLNLASEWARLARDLEQRRSCGSGCPLLKTCTATRSPVIDEGIAATAKAIDFASEPSGGLAIPTA